MSFSEAIFITRLQESSTILSKMCQKSSQAQLFWCILWCTLVCMQRKGYTDYARQTHNSSQASQLHGRAPWRPWQLETNCDGGPHTQHPHAHHSRRPPAEKSLKTLPSMLLARLRLSLQSKTNDSVLFIQVSWDSTSRYTKPHCILHSGCHIQYVYRRNTHNCSWHSQGNTILYFLWLYDWFVSFGEVSIRVQETLRVLEIKLWTDNLCLVVSADEQMGPFCGRKDSRSEVECESQWSEVYCESYVPLRLILFLFSFRIAFLIRFCS